MSSTDKSKYRIFCTPAEAETYLPDTVDVKETYPAFVIVEASDAEISEMKKKFPLEQLSAPKGPPAPPEIASLASTIEAPKARGPHFVVVRFTGPVKKDWLSKLQDEAKGAVVLDSLGSNTLVVKCPDLPCLKTLNQLEKISSTSKYQPYVNLSDDFIAQIEQFNKGTSLEDAEKALSEESSETTSDYIGGKLRAAFFKTEHRDLAMRVLKRKSISDVKISGDRNLMINLFDHKNPESALLDILKRTGLKGIEQVKLKTLWNDVARNIVAGPAIFDPPPNLNLTGNGEIIAIADTGLDTGDPNSLHPDFQGRIRDIQSFPIIPAYNSMLNNPGGDDGPSDLDGHGTHVCGSAAGNGARARQLNLPPIEGLAPEAEIVFQAIDQTTNWNSSGRWQWILWNRRPPERGLFGIPEDLAELLQPAYDQGARIHSNSWGGGEPGKYDMQCSILDQFVFEHQDLLVLVAAGNDGKAIHNGSRGEIELSSVTSPGTAKNCLTVGACENNRPGQFNKTYGQLRGNFQVAPLSADSMTDSADDIAAFSSRGPCTTGRRKPDVVAPGTLILSAKSSLMPNDAPATSQADFLPAQNDYRYESGTSMATPIVAGCAALIRQFLREHHQINNPSAALVKAAIIHSAQYISYRFANSQSRQWCDNEQGWGRVHLPAIMDTSGRFAIEFHDITNGLATGDSRNFPITIPNNASRLRITLCYTDFPGEELINNLNLFAFSPDNEFYNGNDFENIKEVDNSNNVEGIILDNPIAGNWQVRVIASNIIESVQTFSLVISVLGTESDDSASAHPFISTAMPNPQGGDKGNEWVEITNPGTTPLDLSGYFIADRQGGREALSGTVAPSSTIRITLPAGSKVKLANKGDDILLLKGAEEIHKVTYERVKSGQKIDFTPPE